MAQNPDKSGITLDSRRFMTGHPWSARDDNGGADDKTGGDTSKPGNNETTPRQAKMRQNWKT
ncbi:Uu.00g122930.m01.CDS01 [Anthostomella pinea]|uniref:Uu.00g122930.m01.CDS01 n=1 Tax=Anthostomella pinea TaxID=933095 RepID=A0AAI8VIB5_9PEZI|nr:Uu.00g122930.m01.CDS01 [Anthostomella pinea]